MPRPAPSRARSRSHATSSPRPKPAPQPITPQKLNTFLHHLGRTGSITLVAARAGLPRRQLYKRRAADEAFAARWDEALQLGSVQQYDNHLLQFLLRARRREHGTKRAARALKVRTTSLGTSR